MSTEPESNARQRFARDLRRIRQEREVSLAAIHEATQVPVPHLQTFEDGSLYDQSRMNPVYLRAFVRAYAEAIGISPDLVVEHLEAALAGEYQNQIAVRYLDVPSSVGDEPGSPDSADPHSSEGPSDISVEEDDPEGAAQGTSAPEEVSVPLEPTGKDSSTEDEPDNQENGIPSPTASTTAREEGPSTGGREHSFAVDAPSRVRKKTSSQSIQEFWREHRGTLGLVATALLVLALIGGGLGTFFGGGDSSSDSSLRADFAATEPPPDTTVSSDTVLSNSPREQPPQVNLTLGDTLFVTVLATSDVQEMRVQQDDDLRRPYWIEEGDGRVFPFTRRITIENELDSLRLLLEQYPYPSSHTDDEGRVVIRRDTLQNFADTLRGAPSSLPFAPDTVEIDKPAGADSVSQSNRSQR